MEQLAKKSAYVEDNLRVGIRSWRWESVLQWISYIFYGICFGMIPALFKLSNLPSAKPDMVEIMGAINLVLVSFFSVTIVSWSFATDLKQHHKYLYYLIHIANGILLLIPTIMVAMVPITTQGQTSSLDVATNIYWRQMLLLIGLAIHSMVMIGISVGLWISFRRFYGLTKTRLLLANILWIFILSGQIMTFIGAKFNLDNLPETTWYMIVLAAPAMWLITTLVGACAILWIRRKRHILLGDLTYERLVSISDWDYLKNGALFASMVGSATFLIAFNWNNINQMDNFLWVEIVLNILMIVTMATIGIIRLLIDFKSRPWYMIQRWCKKQDMALIFETLFTIMIVKALVLQIVALFNLNWQSDANFHPLAFQLGIVTTVSAMVYISFKPFILQNVTFRNIWSVVAFVACALMIFVFITVFASLFGIDDQFPPFLPALILAFTTVAIAIGLISQIVVFSKTWLNKKEQKLSAKLVEKDPQMQVSDSKTILKERDQAAFNAGYEPPIKNPYVDQSYVEQVQNHQQQILN